MLDHFKLVSEALQSKDVPFVIHKHDPRNGSIHFDVRFLDLHNPKLLHSFAAPSNFLETKDKKVILAKTRDHDPRWLTLKSYRLTEIDKGFATIHIATYKYFDVDFHGELMKGRYKIFKMKNTYREDRWLMVKV
jgi:hypothetical protein